MKKILILAYVFYPDNAIGAIRTTELVLRMSNEYECYVVVSNRTQKKPMRNVHFIYINDYEHDRKPVNNNKPKRHTYIKKTTRIKDILYQFKIIKENLDYLKIFKKKFKSYRNIIFDYILFSYSPLCNLLCALYVKKMYHNIPLIADFRDPMDTPLVPVVPRLLYKMMQDFTCKQSDLIVSVSKGYEKKIVKKKYLKKSYVITNGYANKRFSTHLPKKFSFLYVGSTYGGKRDFSVLFKVLLLLINNNAIDKNDLLIEYAGNDSTGFEKYISLFNMNNYYINLGVLSREECYKKEVECFYQVLSTWNKKNYDGVIPGKFYEYMSSGRKIISICTGDKASSEVGTMIKNLKLGYSFEINSYIEDLYEYINNDYIEYKKGIYNYEPMSISEYSYDSIAKKYMDRINELGD